MSKRWIRPACVLGVVLAIVAGFASHVRAAPAAPVEEIRREQVEAATAQALTELRRTIAAEPIGDGYTVGDLIERTGTRKRFASIIARANQIGGPRWINPETCMVKLEIPAGRVKDTLVEIATLSPIESPVPPEVLQGRLRDWNERKFSATGMSTGASAMAQGPRGRGVCQARDNAVQQTLAAIRPIPLTGDKSVADALAVPQVGQRVEEWLTARPITQIEFPEPGQARVALSVSPDELFERFRIAAGAAAAVANGQAVPLPQDENEWNRVRQAFEQRVTPAVTLGVAKSAPTEAAVQHAAVFQQTGIVPEWVDEQIQAEGKGTARGSQLKAARAAEADAANKLRAQLDPLPLPGGLSIEQAVAQDQALENALDRALLKARTTQVDYQGRDSATVRVQLDLRDVWREIESSR